MMKKLLFTVMLASACHDADPPVSLVAPNAPAVSSTPASVDAGVTIVAPAAAAPVAVSPTPADASPAIPTTFDDALAQGRMLAAKGDRDNAKLALEAAAKLDKHRAEPYVELARLYISDGKRGPALAAAKKATKLAPLSSLAWNTQGRAELIAFDYDGAIEAFTRATEIDPENFWAWNNLGYTELTLKKYDEAVAHLTEATSRKGATGYMFNNLGTALEQLGRFDEARLAFESGGNLGSKEAASSRKRLEGVDSVAKAEPQAKQPDPPKTFEDTEGPADPEIDSGSSSDSDDEPAAPADEPAAPADSAGSGSAE